MKVIDMKDDYILLCKEMKEIGPFNAFKHYTMKYPELFDNILKGLYITKLDNLKPMIESIDFVQNLEIGERNYQNGIPEKVCTIAKDVVHNFKFSDDFDIYLGFELGNIAGFSSPKPNGKPFVYIGLDIEFEETSLRNIIPHEINHMIRLIKIKDIDFYDFQERVISEGLAVCCSIILNKFEFTVNTISEALNLPIMEVAKLNNNVDFLIDKVSKEFGFKMTYENNSDYFTWSKSNSNEKFLLSGYYIGMIIIKELINKGYSLSELTIMPSKLIWEKYISVF